MPLSRDRDSQSVWLIIVMAVATAVLRLSIVSADTLVLWRAYGRAKVLREHLEITKAKPELVVSNGDVLRGLAFQRYLIAGAIWLATTLLVVLILYRFLLPAGVQRMLKQARTNAPGSVGAIWALVLFVLVAAVLPLSAAVTVALFSLIFALSWAWRIRAAT